MNFYSFMFMRIKEPLKRYKMITIRLLHMQHRIWCNRAKVV